MDLARKVGRLFSVPAHALTGDVVHHVRDNHAGGVICLTGCLAARTSQRILQGKPADVGGYDQPDDKKASAALRPSKTLNDILVTV